MHLWLNLLHLLNCITKDLSFSIKNPVSSSGNWNRCWSSDSTTGHISWCLPLVDKVIGTIFTVHAPSENEELASLASWLLAAVPWALAVDLHLGFYMLQPSSGKYDYLWPTWGDDHFIQCCIYHHFSYYSIETFFSLALSTQILFLVSWEASGKRTKKLQRCTFSYCVRLDQGHWWLNLLPSSGVSFESD